MLWIYRNYTSPKSNSRHFVSGISLFQTAAMTVNKLTLKTTASAAQGMYNPGVGRPVKSLLIFSNTFFCKEPVGIFGFTAGHTISWNYPPLQL